MGNFADLAQGIVVWLVIVLIVMLILRELWCWYFKLNKIVSLLTDIRDSLKTVRDTNSIATAEPEGDTQKEAPPSKTDTPAQSVNYSGSV